MFFYTLKCRIHRHQERIAKFRAWRSLLQDNPGRYRMLAGNDGWNPVLQVRVGDGDWFTVGTLCQEIFHGQI